MADNVIFSRKPYNITYYKNGERHTIRRVPPERLHNIWPEDEVSLIAGQSQDFQKGDEVEVQHISPRNPNVLQLVNDEGATTFAEYFNVELENPIGPRSGLDAEAIAKSYRYLNWP